MKASETVWEIIWKTPDGVEHLKHTFTPLAHELFIEDEIIRQLQLGNPRPKFEVRILVG